MSLSRKAINFDLSTNELKKHFKDTREPYAKIKTFMLENGFEHRQYSGYNSMEIMDEFEIYDVIRKLHKTFNWLKPCIIRFDVTDIGEQHDFRFVFQDEKFKISPTKVHSQKEQAKKQLMKQVKQGLQRDNKEPSKDKDIER